MKYLISTCDRDRDLDLDTTICSRNLRSCVVVENMTPLEHLLSFHRHAHHMHLHSTLANEVKSTSPALAQRTAYHSHQFSFISRDRRFPRSSRAGVHAPAGASPYQIPMYICSTSSNHGTPTHSPHPLTSPPNLAS